MDLAMASAAPIEIVVGDKKYTFPRLRLKELGEFAEKLRAVDRAHLLVNLEESGVDATAKLAALEAFDKEGPSIQCVVNSVFRLAGAREILFASLKLGDPTATMEQVDDIPLRPDDLGWTAYQIIGFDRPARDAKPDDDKRSDPTSSETGS